jgi:hypothetical protein
MHNIKAIGKTGFRSLKSFCFIALLLLFSFPLMAQQAAEKVQMADGLRSSGKIYVVVAVLLTVLAGLFIYVISLDRKISKLEKEPPVENIH